MADDAAQIVRLLNQTLASNDGASIRTATEALDRLSLQLPRFSLHLLSIASGGENPSHRVAAATYLKNFTRRSVDTGGKNFEVSKEFKDQLVRALLQVEPAVLKVLIEALRAVVVAEFVKQNSWPELVPELRYAIENSDHMSSNSNCKWSTVNALMVLLTIVKPFQYFLSPKVSKEPVPQQLEIITKEILVPLVSAFHLFVEKALTTHGRAELGTDKILLIICKCLYFAVRSHMPSALAPLLTSLSRDMIRILDSLSFDQNVSAADGCFLMLKTGKRILLIFSNLVTRHRKYSDRLMPDILNCSLKIVKHSSNISALDFLHEKIISLAFDVISRVLETGPGWRLVSPHFSCLLDSAIFPALVLNERDLSEWEEDADEFIRKNLPSEIEEISGWREDLFTARKSALNLLGVISMSKGPPISTSSVTSKRKKGGNNKRNNHRCSMGELLVLPFLSKFSVPSKDNLLDARISNAYFGVLLAYGGLQDFIQEQSPEHVATLVRTRVLPVYSTPGCSPYVIASANWVLGELACCLREEMKADVYSSLLRALATPDEVDTRCYPVRVSAAGGIASLLKNEYPPPEWLPLLQIIIGRIGDEDEENIILFQLLSCMAEAENEDVTIHIPYVISSLVSAILKYMHPPLDPWPQVVVRGFEALATIAQAWQSSKPEDEQEDQLTKMWLSGQATISKALSALLQQAWLVTDVPPASCIDHLSTLLCCIMLAINDSNMFVELKLSELLLAWANLIASWNAWEEAEDFSVFDCIREAVGLSRKYDFKNFFYREMPSPPAMPVCQQSIIESIGTFVSEAIRQYPSATLRACSCVHTLLHVPNYSCNSEGVRQSLVIVFSRAAFTRFQEIRDESCSLWRPLLLAISSCYLCYSEIVEGVLEKDSGGFELWVSSLAFSCSCAFEATLSVVSEIKLYVITLVKVIERLLESRPRTSKDCLVQSCFISLIEVSLRLKQVQEESEDDEDDGEAGENEDVDDETDYDDEESESDECEETEEEFLERYAKAAAALEEGTVVEEGDAEDEEHEDEIDLGSLDEVEHQRLVFSLMEKHRSALPPIPSELIPSFVDAFPVFTIFFPLP